MTPENVVWLMKPATEQGCDLDPHSDDPSPAAMGIGWLLTGMEWDTGYGTGPLSTHPGKRSGYKPGEKLLADYLTSVTLDTISNWRSMVSSQIGKSS